MDPSPELALIAPDASPREAAAVAAAIERFKRDTAPPLAAPLAPPKSPWQQAALQEGVSRRPSEYM